MQAPSPSIHAKVLPREEISHAVVSSEIAKQLSLNFTATIEKQFHFGRYPNGNSRVLEENPFLLESERLHLDEKGIVKVGTVVAPGMVAVSSIKPAKLNPEEALLAAIFGSTSSQRINDASIRFGVNDEGFTVISVKHESAREILTNDGIRSPRGVTDRITVTLQRQCPLLEGEFVEIGGRPVVISEILSGSDLAALACGHPVDAIVPRSVGLPTDDTGTCRVEITRNCPLALERIQTRRIGRFHVKDQSPTTSRNQIPQEINADQIAWLLNRGLEGTSKELAILKCDERVHRDKLHEFANSTGEAPLFVEVAAPESLFEVVEYLRVLGLDAQIEAVNQRACLQLSPASDEQRAAIACHVIDNGNLFSARTKSPERGGLLCERIFGPTTHSRRQTGARIELSSPVVPIIYRLGEHPLISQILGLEIADIESVLSGELALDSTLKLQHSTNATCEHFGPIAIERLLLHCPNRSPFDPKNLICRSVYVLPPDFRPATFLSSRFSLRDDLNHLYARVVFWNRRLASWIASAATPQQIEYGRLMLQSAVDNLQANEWMAVPSVDEDHTPYRSALKLLEERLCGSMTKTVDWSGAARVISDTSLTNQDCSLPAPVFDALQCRVEHPVLLSGGECFIACSPRRSTEQIIRISQESLARLNLKPGDTCQVFRLLTSAALQEAAGLKDRHPTTVTIDADAAHANYQLSDLFDAISSGKPLHLDSPQGFMLAGTGSLARLADADAILPTAETRDLPELTPHPPSMTEIHEVIDLLAFESLLISTSSFEAESARQPIGLGRIGGRPWLPLGTQWPHVDGVAVPFLAQLPLDPQYNASLPFDVSEPMMLTIFWADHWWSSGNTNTPCIILHSLEELVHCEPPPGTPERPPMKAHLEAKRQLPPVGEIWNVLHTCFGELPTEMVDALQLSLKEDDRQITKHSRIGGNPYWIQESRPRFIAQLFAHDLTGIEFGDAGCLYIVGPNAHELRGFVQCY